MSTLYVVATPIGNLEDISLRAIRVLGEIDVLACEDTRRTRILFDRHKIPRPQKIISYREENEKTASLGIVKLLEEGKKVALVSDAGYPCLSDPGYRLISEALRRGIRVEVIPGAGAIETALISSGLPTHRFTFLGFPPRKESQLKRFLESVREYEHTLVFFESPRRLARFLKTALEVLGDRESAVCIELTKMFEQTTRGRLSELAKRFGEKKVKGEVTVVISGKLQEGGEV